MVCLASTLLLFGLTLVHRTSAQASALLFVPGFDGDDLQGEEVGVGTDGTTFVLSGTINTDGIVAPFTMTLVQAATQVIEIAAVRTGKGQDDVIGIGVECELGGDEADCVQVFTFAGGGGATTVQGTIPIQPTAVPIVNAQGGSISPSSAIPPSNTPSNGGDGDGDNDGDGGAFDNGDNDGSDADDGPDEHGSDDGNSIGSTAGFSTNPASGASPTAQANLPPGLAPKKSAGIRSLASGLTILSPVFVILYTLS